jgi:hypothetical protein
MDALFFAINLEKLGSEGCRPKNELSFKKSFGVNVFLIVIRFGSPIGGTAVNPSIPPSKRMTEILPGGLSFVKPGIGTPARNNEAPEYFRKSLLVIL